MVQEGEKIVTEILCKWTLIFFPTSCNGKMNWSIFESRLFALEISRLMHASHHFDRLNQNFWLKESASGLQFV